MNFSLERRIQLAFLMAILAIVIVTSMSLYSLRGIRNVAQQAGSPDLTYHLNLRGAVNGLRDARIQFMKNPSQASELERHRGLLEDAMKNLELLAGATASGGDPIEELKTLETELRVYQNLFYQTLGTAAEKQRAELTTRLSDLENRNASLVAAVGRELFVGLKQRQDQVKNLSIAAEQGLIHVTVISLLAALLIGLVAPWYVRVPVARINDFLYELRQGNWQAVLKGADQANEIGLLMKNINLTVQQLSEYDQAKTHKIRELSDVLERMVNLLEDPMIVLDSEQRIVSLNHPAFDTFQLSSEVIGKPVEESSLAEPVRDLLEELCIAQSKVEKRRFEWQDESGRRRRSVVTADFARDTNGRVRQAFVVFHAA